MYGTCHNKDYHERLYERPFPFLLYARTRSCQTPVCVVFRRPYHLYARWPSTPIFVKCRISTRRCESFGMFAERSKCYSCLSSVRARGCCLLFRVFITACASQDGVFRLREAEIPCLLSLQEELREIARCLAEEGYSVTKVGVAKLLRHYKKTLGAKWMLIFSLSKSFVEIRYFTPL